MNILFTCSRNQWRSPTAESIFKNHAFHQVRSGGTSATARIKVNAKMIIWADLIFVMEKKHKQRLAETFAEEISNKEIVILNIPDNYKFMDEELIIELQSKTSAHF